MVLPRKLTFQIYSQVFVRLLALHVSTILFFPLLMLLRSQTFSPVCNRRRVIRLRFMIYFNTVKIKILADHGVQRKDSRMTGHLTLFLSPFIALYRHLYVT